MKITRKIFCLVSAVFMCVSLAACSGAELKTVYELPYYDGSEYDDVTNKPIYSTDLWRRNDDLCTLFICKQSFLFRVYFSNTLYRRFSFWAIVLIVQICTLY